MSEHYKSKYRVRAGQGFDSSIGRHYSGSGGKVPGFVSLSVVMAILDLAWG